MSGEGKAGHQEHAQRRQDAQRNEMGLQFEGVHRVDLLFTGLSVIIIAAAV